MTGVYKWMGLTAVGAAVILFVPLSPADDVKSKPPSTDQADKQAAQASDVELLAAAYRLAEIGEKYKSPEALVAAGSLILKLKALTKGELGELALKPEVQDENDKPIEGAKVEVPKPESLEEIAQGFFDTASGLGTELKASHEVEAMIKAAKGRKYDAGARGAKGGPKVLTGTVGPHQTHTYHISFDAHAIAAIGFHASAPLRAKMIQGSQIHFDQVLATGEYRWMPQGKKGATVVITVQNPHKSKVTYQLFSN